VTTPRGFPALPQIASGSSDITAMDATPYPQPIARRRRRVRAELSGMWSCPSRTCVVFTPWRRRASCAVDLPVVVAAGAGVALEVPATTVVLALSDPADPRVELPDLTHIDTWAHAQVTATACPATR